MVTTFVRVAQHATTAMAVERWSGAIVNITNLNNVDGKKLFSTRDVAAAFLRVAPYVTTAEAAKYWLYALSNITVHEPGVKFFRSLLPSIEEKQKLFDNDRVQELIEVLKR